jgi:hypothetical protein
MMVYMWAILFTLFSLDAFALNSEATGFDVSSGSTKEITAHGLTKKILNARVRSIFVATKSSAEFASFITNLPPNVFFISDFTTLDPSHTSPSNSLSNNNLTVILNHGSGVSHSSDGKSTGKWYFEATADSNNHFMPGLTKNSLFSQTNPWLTNFVYFLYTFPNPDQSVEGVNFSTTNNVTGGSDYTGGEKISVAVDFDAGKLWYAIDCVWYNSGDPANGTNPVVSGMEKTVYFPSIYGERGVTATANFGQNSFDCTVPTGFFPGWTTNTESAVSSGAQFKKASGQFLSKAANTGDSQKKFTFSSWVKRSVLTTGSTFFGLKNFHTSSNTFTSLYFNDEDKLGVYTVDGGTDYSFFTTGLFRDTSAWYHIVLSVDTSLSTASDRAKIYVNGVLQAGTAVHGAIPQNYNFHTNSASRIASYTEGNNHFDGYMADTYYIDGLSLDAASFGEVSSTTNVWTPKAYSGTYGTNGYHLDYSLSANPGNDSSGQDNSFTNNGSLITVSDNPSNNFATYNGAATYGSVVSGAGLSTASLEGNFGKAYGTLFSDNFYFEMTVGNVSHGGVGLVREDSVDVDNATHVADGFIHIENPGNVIVNGTTVGTFSSYANGDVIGAWLKDGELYYAVNGTTANSGTAVATGITGNWSAAALRGSSGGDPSPITVNFGATSFAHTRPAGVNRLCTEDFATPDIIKSNQYFGIMTYSGDGTAKNITSDKVDFTPDLVWGKAYNASASHIFYDSVRGAGKSLYTPSPLTEDSTAGQLDSFIQGGFHHPADSSGHLNFSGREYVSWMWKEDNATAGFDIVSFSGDGAASRDIAHSLGAAPEFILIQNRTDSTDWFLDHKDLASVDSTLKLNTNSAQGTFTTGKYGDHTTTTFQVKQGSSDANSVNGSGDNMIAYLFKSVDGFSKMGNYTGNGQSDGSFVYTGFKPALIIIKQINTTNSWRVFDTKRDSSNKAFHYLVPDTIDAENGTSNTTDIDFLSNGFKMRGTASTINTSGGTYIYAAFAEAPGKYSRAGHVDVSQAVTESELASGSAKFDLSSSNYLSKTGATPDSSQKFTFSSWVKRSSFNGLATGLTDFYSNGTTFTIVDFNPENNIRLYTIKTAGTTDYSFQTNAVFRDVSAWYHIVIEVDTTLATTADRIKMYVNGSLQSGTTPNGAVPQNYNFDLNFNTRIGSLANGDRHFDGYMSDTYFIDGLSLDASNFGKINSTTGIWSPKEYNGSFGTNGYHLNYSDANDLGKDNSGNNNHFTNNNNVSNTNDSPTNNFATINFIDNRLNSGSVLGQYSNAGLKWGNSAASVSGGAKATFALGQEKIYVEATVTAVGSPGDCAMGVADPSIDWSTTGGPTNTLGTWSWSAIGRYNDGDTPSFTGGEPTIANSDIIMMAYDPVSGKLWFGKNGTWNGSGDPANGANPTITVDSPKELIPFVFGYSSVVWDLNFGQNGFTYAQPTGFKAISTANLPTPSIIKPNQYYATMAYAGDGTSRNITSSNVDFTPDIVWGKSHDNPNSYLFYDSETGGQNSIWSDNASAEDTTAGTQLDSFISGGFHHLADSSGYLNTSGRNYVTWLWKEDPTSGVDIVNFTGDNAASRDINHSLGAIPEFIMVKNRADSANWFIEHTGLSNVDKSLNLDNGDAETTRTTGKFGTHTSSIFQVKQGSSNANSVNGSGDSMSAYLFRSIEGFSRFSKYTGNGNANGTFIYTGFRPAFIIIKQSSAANSWRIYDSTRDPHNLSVHYLAPDVADVQNTSSNTTDIDILSNGFKIRGNASTINTSGATYVYGAFAEAPLKYSKAR